MCSLETKLDTISNNLANMETTGFKRDRANFEDLFYRHYRMPGVQDSSGQYTAVGTQIGMGTRISSTQTDFKQGSFKTTSGQLDIAIEGRGFFRVLDPTGEVRYTRSGNFTVNANGQVVMGSAQTGRLLDPNITIPSDATSITISADGKVTVKQPGNTNMNQVGTIELSTFVNPEGLLKVGENLYSETDSSGTATSGVPGQLGIGTLQQSALEAANVEPVTELIDLITTQRAFEMNSQCVQTGDELLQTVANLKRS